MRLFEFLTRFVGRGRGCRIPIVPWAVFYSWGPQEYGVRGSLTVQLKRTITQKIENPLATKLLMGTLTGAVITIDYVHGAIAITSGNGV